MNRRTFLRWIGIAPLAASAAPASATFYAAHSAAEVEVEERGELVALPRVAGTFRVYGPHLRLDGEELRPCDCDGDPCVLADIAMSGPHRWINLR